MQEKREEIQKLAVESALAHHRSTLCISMRVGKTYIGLQYLDRICNANSKVLVVAPALSIFQGWIEDAIKFRMEHLLRNIHFSTYLSLYKQDNDYNVIILDEVHSLKFRHSEYLDDYDGPILGLTGTKPKHPLSEKYRMLEKFCPVSFEYTTNEAVKDGILNDYRIFIHLLDLSREKVVKVKRRDGGIFYQSEVDRYRYYNTPFSQAQEDYETGYECLRKLYDTDAVTLNERLTRSNSIETQKSYLNQVKDRLKKEAMFLGRALMGMPTKERYTARLLKTIREKCIIFANTKDQADLLCRFSYHSGNKASKENLELFKSGKIQALSCINQLSEGVTIPGLKECIILHAYGSEKKSPQRLARCLSLKPHEVATIHILCFRDTRDEIWIHDALSSLDEEKITYIEANEYMLNKAA